MVSPYFPGVCRLTEKRNGAVTLATYTYDDTAGGYYGRLWRVKTAKQPGDTPVLQDVKHTWDAGGNLVQRDTLITEPSTYETETFSYDSLDRLTGASGPYTESFSYNAIGNMLSKNGVSYTYPAPGSPRPHAVSAAGGTNYSYDANGNMITRSSQALAWNVENQLQSVTDGGVTTTFVYDGDGKRRTIRVTCAQ